MSRVCPDCGEALEPDERFCGSCGCYLDWTESADAPAEPEPQPAEVVADPAPRGIGERVRSALGVGDRPPPPPAPAGPLPTGRPVPEAPPVLDVRGTAGRPTAATPTSPTSPAAAQQPRAQQPGPPQRQARPASALPPPEPLEPGDLVCGNCGAGNKPSRKFCRRCGDDLAKAEVAKISWWKRIFRRKPNVIEVGARPKAPRSGRRFPVKLLVVLGVLGALAFGGYLFRDLAIGGVEAIRDRLADVEQTRPTKAKASHSAQGHGANLAIDGVPEKYWAPEKPGKGIDEWVEVTFDSPVRLVYVLVTPGVSKTDEEAFVASGRPSELKVTVDGADGTIDEDVIHLEDKRGPQEFHIAESDVTKVRFEIEDSYAGAKGSHTAIGEIEFFTRK